MDNTVESKSMSTSVTAASNPWSTSHRSNTAESAPSGPPSARSKAPGAGRGLANSNNNLDWSSPTSSKTATSIGGGATSQDRRAGVPSSLDTSAQPFNPATLHDSPTTTNHATGQSQYSSHFSPHNSNGPSRSVSTSVVGSIGSERRAANSSANESVKSSRATSPTPQQAPSSLQNSIGNLRTASAAREFHPTIAVSNAHDSNTPVNGSSASSSTAELESAFDAMLRGSPLFQAVLTRISQLEGHVNSLLAYALPGGTGNAGTGQSAAPLSLVPPSGSQNYDSTPTRSPSVVSTTGSFLSAQTSGPYGNPSNLSNSISATSVMSTNLHSPAVPNAAFIHAATEPSTPNSERDVIRQLTVQLSALGNQVAQLTAQQSQIVPAMLQSPSVMSTPGATPLSASAGPWSFDGQQGYGPPSAGSHAGPHFMNGRPALSALRATSYDVQRGGPGPRNGPFGDERDGPRSALPSGKRGPHHLHAPTPLGMGSRRHSTDIVDNMNAAAETASGMQGAGGGNQSLLGKWESLGVSGDLLRAIVKYGIGPPSKIQMKAIPCILNSQDIVAQASSIQERIQCYVIPVLQHVYNKMMRSSTPKLADNGDAPRTSTGIHAMIITATIDQAGQAHRMCLGLGQSLGIASMLAVGQGDVTAELNSLTNNPPHLLVGTPQKILDLLSLRSAAADRMTLLVIDEMDQLIARNLSEHVNNVAKLLPSPTSGPGSVGRDRSNRPLGRADNASASSPTRSDNDRQTAIFSCTVPQEVLNFASALNLREPVRVLVRRENNQENGPTNGQAPNLRGMKHFFLYLAVSGTGSGGPGHIDGRQMTSPAVREWKLEALADLCADADFTQAVVFCSSLDSVDAVQYKLMSRSIEAYVLHGDMGPAARNTVISKFRSSNGRGVGIKRVLVVYDALCRTLSDIHQVALVVNYDLPRAVEDYVHRVTCATASGYSRAGTSVNMAVNAGDVDMLRNIESFYRIKINELPPTLHNII